MWIEFQFFVYNYAQLLYFLGYWSFFTCTFDADVTLLAKSWRKWRFWRNFAKVIEEIFRLNILTCREGSQMSTNLAKMVNLAKVATLTKFRQRSCRNLSTEYINLLWRVPKCCRIWRKWQIWQKWRFWWNFAKGVDDILSCLEGPQNVGENGEFGRSGDSDKISTRVLTKFLTEYINVKYMWSICEVSFLFELRL